MTGFLDDYQPVEDRLREFWKEHPYGRVLTELLHHEDGDYIVMASVYRGDETSQQPPAATGLAHDSTSTLPANMKASALETCETSAIGRALGNLGYAPKGKRPSREEMAKSSGGGDGGREREPATAPPSSGSLAELLEAVAGSEQRAINLVNKASHTNYAKSELESLEEEDWAAGLALAKGGK